MNYFEQELRRIAGACSGFRNPVFSGRACYADLGGDNRVKLQFVTLGTHERYAAVKATVLNRTDGEVDSLLFRFRDTWGKKHNLSNDGGIPHIWTYKGESEWYSYYPTGADIKKLASEVDAYISVFAERSPVVEKSEAHSGGKDSVIQTIRNAKQNPKPHKGTSSRGKSDPEL